MTIFPPLPMSGLFHELTYFIICVPLSVLERDSVFTQQIQSHNGGSAC